MREKPVIAIDGPPGSGKSTLARALSEKFGYKMIDTGAMYRAAALVAQMKNVDFEDGLSLKRLILEVSIDFHVDENGQKIMVDGEIVEELIRTEEMGMNASRVSRVDEVRSALVEKQREMGGKGGIVCEGRDATTVIFPDADYRFFIDAGAWKRAERRYRELSESGGDESFQEIYEELIRRDIQDSTRSNSPLKLVEGVTYINTTSLSEEGVVEAVMKIMGDRAG